MSTSSLWVQTSDVKTTIDVDDVRRVRPGWNGRRYSNDITLHPDSAIRPNWARVSPNMVRLRPNLGAFDQIWQGIGQDWSAFDHIWPGIHQIWPGCPRIWRDFVKSWPGFGYICRLRPTLPAFGQDLARIRPKFARIWQTNAWIPAKFGELDRGLPDSGRDMLCDRSWLELRKIVAVV